MDADSNRKRLVAIAPVVRANAPHIRVHVAQNPATAVRGSRFVFAAIRPGGQGPR